MEKINPETPDLTQENIDKIAELFPDVVTETLGEDGNVVRAIDFDALKGDLFGEVVEGKKERYQFTWPGKAAAKLEARTPCDKTMRPCPEESVNWDTTQNLYIEGDNLEALKIMRETYAGKVKLIYIDPPYNTGHDFIYDDDFSQSRDDYEEASDEFDEEGGRLVANPESNGRFHSDWCSMIYPRLLLARDLLEGSGSIFINIDHVEFANLKKICDEIFGESCFMAHVAWKSSDSSNNNAMTFSEDFNDVLIYSKSPEWRPIFLDDPEKRKHYKNPDNDPRGPWFDGGDVSNPGVRPNLQFDITSPNGTIIKHPSNGWRWSRDKMNEMFASGELRFSSDETRIIKRRYLADMKGLPPSTLWNDTSKTGHTRAAKYELKALFPELSASQLFTTPKPISLIDYILSISTTSDDIVLDFFAGSGTTASALMKHNQKTGKNLHFIAVQIDEPAEGTPFSNLFEMGKERLVREGLEISQCAKAHDTQLKLGEPSQTVFDIGFRILKIDSSNYQDTYSEPDVFVQDSLSLYVDNLKTDRTSEDLLFQVMPKFRIPYSATIDKINLDGKEVFDVNNGQLLVCFDANVGVDTIEEIAKRKPVYAVLRDASLVDDSTAANFEELFKTFSPDTIRRVI